MISETLKRQYDTLRRNAGWVKLPGRTLIELTGNDRCKFLHNFCTADINAGTVGENRELFILDSRGKTLSFGHVLFRPKSLLISIAGSESGPIVQQHLDKYIIRDDVEVHDRSADFVSYFVTGEESKSVLSPLFGDTEFNQNCDVDFGNRNAIAAELELAGNGRLFFVQNADAPAFVQVLTEAGIEECPAESLEIIRIENRTPWFGVEVDETNLPQELRRDEKAISFTKGCYLGQETVAKIDAFGHVNKFLVSILCDGDEVKPGQEIHVDGKKVGMTKSVTYSPQASATVATGYVKCKMTDAGTEVQIEDINGKIV